MMKLPQRRYYYKYQPIPLFTMVATKMSVSRIARTQKSLSFTSDFDGSENNSIEMEFGVHLYRVSFALNLGSGHPVG
jgi:hypothetical protein